MNDILEFIIVIVFLSIIGFGIFTNLIPMMIITLGLMNSILTICIALLIVVILTILEDKE